MDMQVDNLLIMNDYRDCVVQDKVVRLCFRVTEAATGKLLQYGDDLTYLHGGYGGAFRKVEQAMEGGKIGDRIEVSLTPDEGYGEHDPQLVMSLPLEHFEGDAPEPGTLVEGECPDGQSQVFTVANVSSHDVTLDGNHPFAGKVLDFQFEIVEIRDSMEAERTAGFAFDGMHR